VIFFDIDTQVDFLEPDGALYVPEGVTLHGAIGRLLGAARTHRVTTISSRCAHEPGDPEFTQFPPHCLEGTRGAQRIFEELPGLPRHEIPVDATLAGEPVERSHLEPGHHYVVRKKAFDLFSNRWLDGIRQQGAFRGETCVVFGVATDYCVRACVLGLVSAGAKVRVVQDAIGGVAEESTAQTLAEWERAGVSWTTTEEVLMELASPDATE
jgi:nicotinamidase/pyrazinamidase